MIKRLYTVYDNVAESATGPLLVFPNDAAARRAFQDALTGETSLAAHPQDYDLCCVGEFDSVSGQVTGHPAHEVVITGKVIMELLNRDVPSQES